jgi:hypothetical protein
MASCMGVKCGFRMRLCMVDKTKIVGKTLANTRPQYDLSLPVRKVRLSQPYFFHVSFPRSHTPKVMPANIKHLASDQNVF